MHHNRNGWDISEFVINNYSGKDTEELNL